MADAIINTTNSSVSVIGANDIAYINGFSGRFSAKIKNGVLILKNKDTKAVITIGVATGSKIAFLNGSATIDLAAGTIGGKKPVSFKKATFDAGLTSENTFYAAVPFALTEGVDTFKGSKLNDTFNAFAAKTVFTANDTLDGGDGTDTLNIYMEHNDEITNIEFPAFASVKNIEIINLYSDPRDTHVFEEGEDVDASKFEGAKQIWQINDANDVEELAAGTTVGFRNVKNASLSVDATATATKVDVALDRFDGDLSVYGPKVGAVTVAGILGNAFTEGTPNAFALYVNTDEKVLALNTAVATTLAYDSTAIEEINAGASTGSITVTVDNADKFTSGSGNDEVTVGATTKAVATGAGNDTVTLTGLDAGTITGTLAGGVGTDTLKTTTADAAAGSASATKNLGSQLSGFEILSLTDAVSVDTTLDMARLGNISTVISVGNNAVGNVGVAGEFTVSFENTNNSADDFTASIVIAGKTITVSQNAQPTNFVTEVRNALATDSAVAAKYTISNVITGTKGGTFTITEKSGNFGGAVPTLTSDMSSYGVTTVQLGSATTDGGLVVNNFVNGGTFELTGNNNGLINILVKDSLTGTSDVLNLSLKSADVLLGGTIGATNVETVNIVTTDSNTTAHNNSLTLVASSATTIKVSGNAGLNLTNADNAKVTSFDASGVTAGSVTFASANATTTASVNIKGGAGDDLLTGNAAKDTIIAGAGKDTVNGGAGADTITLGAGNDKYVLANSTHSTVLAKDVITDFVANKYGQGTDGAATTAGATADSTKINGDLIDLDAVNVLNLVKVAVVGNAVDAQLAIQALYEDSADTTVNVALDSATGNLYIDLDNNGSVDSMIQLTGVTTITEAAFVV